MVDMFSDFSNESIWEHLDDPATRAIASTVSTVAAEAQWAGVGSGCTVLTVALIGLVVAIRRNLQMVERVLGHLQSCLLATTRLIRREDEAAVPSPPIAHPETVVEMRNLSDSQRIGIRKMIQRDCPAPSSAVQQWI